MLPRRRRTLEIKGCRIKFLTAVKLLCAKQPFRSNSKPHFRIIQNFFLKTHFKNSYSFDKILAVKTSWKFPIRLKRIVFLDNLV